MKIIAGNYFQIHLKAPLILNGVCVRWKGWMDLERLDGVGCLEYDEENAVIEDAKLREQVELYNRRLREIEERNKATSRHLAGLVSSSGHSQFPSHHHLQSDLLLEVRSGAQQLAGKPAGKTTRMQLEFKFRVFVIREFRYFCTATNCRGRFLLN